MLWSGSNEDLFTRSRIIDHIFVPLFFTSEEHPYLAVFVERMKTAIPRPQVMSYPEIENLMNPEMQAALDGTKSVEAALNAAVAEIDKQLAGE